MKKALVFVSLIFVLFTIITQASDVRTSEIRLAPWLETRVSQYEKYLTLENLEKMEWKDFGDFYLLKSQDGEFVVTIQYNEKGFGSFIIEGSRRLMAVLSLNMGHGKNFEFYFGLERLERILCPSGFSQFPHQVFQWLVKRGALQFPKGLPLHIKRFLKEKATPDVFVYRSYVRY